MVTNDQDSNETVVIAVVSGDDEIFPVVSGVWKRKNENYVYLSILSGRLRDRLIRPQKPKVPLP